MSQRSATALVPMPAVQGTHCAGVGCDHDELAGSGFEPVAPGARMTARHRRASTGRRVRLQVAAVPVSPRPAAHST